MSEHLLLRDGCFKSYLATLLWDSWSHPETRYQMTTWAMIVHVLFFGSSSDTMRQLLHGPAFFLSHSILAGWSQLTYFNPQSMADRPRNSPCHSRRAGGSARCSPARWRFE